MKKYINFFGYYTLIVLILSFSTIILHEMGHFIFGILNNCEEIRVVLFDQKILNSYTEMRCPVKTSSIGLGLSGLILILPVTLIYLFLFKNFEKYFGLIIFGFNFVLSSYDFQTYLKIPFSEIFSLIGIIIVIIGEYYLIKSVLGY